MIKRIQEEFIKKIASGVDPVLAFREIVKEYFVELYARDFVSHEKRNRYPDLNKYEKNLEEKTFNKIGQEVKDEKLYTKRKTMNWDEQEIIYKVVIVKPINKNEE